MPEKQKSDSQMTQVLDTTAIQDGSLAVATTPEASKLTATIFHLDDFRKKNTNYFDTCMPRSQTDTSSTWPVGATSD